MLGGNLMCTFAETYWWEALTCPLAQSYRVLWYSGTWEYSPCRWSMEPIENRQTRHLRRLEWHLDRWFKSLIYPGAELFGELWNTAMIAWCSFWVLMEPGIRASPELIASMRFCRIDNPFHAMHFIAVLSSLFSFSFSSWTRCRDDSQKVSPCNSPRVIDRWSMDEMRRKNSPNKNPLLRKMPYRLGRESNRGPIADQ